MRTHTVARLAVITATSALTVGMLCPAPAPAAPTPGVTDLYGRVVDDAGQPLGQVYVSIYNAVTGNLLTDVETQADGVWHFDDLDTDAVGSYKLHFHYDGSQYGQLGYQPVYFGQEPTLARATTIPEPPANASTNVGDTRLTKYAGITGSVTAPGFNLADSIYDVVEVTAYDSDDRDADYTQADVNPTNAFPDGSYFLSHGLPGQAYKVRFFGRDYNPATGTSTSFVGEFYKSGSTFAQAAPTMLGPPGSVTTLEPMTLTNTLRASQLPTITGEPRVGRTLTATPGLWNANARAEYSYRWLRGSAVVGTAATYTPTPADLTRPLLVEVTSRIDDFIGTATSAPSAPVKYASRLTVRGKRATVGGKTAVVLSLRVKVPGLRSAKVEGKVVVKEKGKKVATGKVEKGKLVLSISEPGQGTHTYVVTYLGTKTIAGDESSQKVSVS